VHKAFEWIKTSSIIDKQGHFAALRFYLQAINDHSLLDKLKILKSKKNR